MDPRADEQRPHGRRALGAEQERVERFGEAVGGEPAGQGGGQRVVAQGAVARDQLVQRQRGAAPLEALLGERPERGVDGLGGGLVGGVAGEGERVGVEEGDGVRGVPRQGLTVGDEGAPRRARVLPRRPEGVVLAGEVAAKGLAEGLGDAGLAGVGGTAQARPEAFGEIRERGLGGGEVGRRVVLGAGAGPQPAGRLDQPGAEEEVPRPGEDGRLAEGRARGQQILQEERPRRVGHPPQTPRVSARQGRLGQQFPQQGVAAPPGEAEGREGERPAPLAQPRPDQPRIQPRRGDGHARLPRRAQEGLGGLGGEPKVEPHAAQDVLPRAPQPRRRQRPHRRAKEVRRPRRAAKPAQRPQQRVSRLTAQLREQRAQRLHPRRAGREPPPRQRGQRREARRGQNRRVGPERQRRPAPGGCPLRRFLRHRGLPPARPAPREGAGRRSSLRGGGGAPPPPRPAPAAPTPSAREARGRSRSPSNHHTRGH